MKKQENIQIRMKFYLNGSKQNIEELYKIDNESNKIISNTLQTFEMGNMIVSIINKYDDICNIINKFIDKTNTSNSLSIDEIIKTYEKLTKKLKAKELTILADLLNIDFYNFYHRTEEVEKYDILTDKEYSKFQGIIFNNNYIRRKGFTNHSFNKFLVDFKQHLTNMKELTENTFSLNSNKNNVDIYAIVSAKLPKMSIEYIEDIKSGIQSYTYEINNIEDLFVASIYNLHLSKKFILRCGYCSNLFIPKTRKIDQKYCYEVDQYGEYTCRNKGRKRQYYQRIKEKSNQLTL